LLPCASMTAASPAGLRYGAVHAPYAYPSSCSITPSSEMCLKILIFLILFLLLLDAVRAMFVICVKQPNEKEISHGRGQWQDCVRSIPVGAVGFIDWLGRGAFSTATSQ